MRPLAHWARQPLSLCLGPLSLEAGFSKAHLRKQLGFSPALCMLGLKNATLIHKRIYLTATASIGQPPRRPRAMRKLYSSVL